MLRQSAVAPAVAVVAVLAGCGGTPQPKETVTYWKDVAPLVNAKCLGCHQQGGVAPIQLDSYANLKTYAASVAAQTSSKKMPPFLVTHDGSCGNFDSANQTLTDTEIDTLQKWAGSSMVEGTEVTLEKPKVTHLEGSNAEVMTPTLVPMAQGGQLAVNDEYRCYLVDLPQSGNAYITGYEVLPGNPAMVHHVLGFVIDPDKMVMGGQTNAQVMAALDAKDPDRMGWPCYGLAGDGVQVDSVPVSWAPGQGPVNFPAGVGVTKRATDKLVLQLHYNLADPKVVGQSDSTTVRLKLEGSVQRKAMSLFWDPLLESLYAPMPTVIPPMSPHASLSWSTTLGTEFPYLSALPYVDLVGVLPHMHGRGVKQTLQLGETGSQQCLSEVQHWDFNWQKFYSYAGTPTRLTKDSKLSLSCEWDTSMDQQPVLPGWGTRNEMCLTVMMVALPEGI
jgi:hypothetical protein